MNVYIPGAIGALIVVATMFELLRRRKLAEKYAALWLVVGVGVVVVAAAPGLLTDVSDLVGVKTPSNLLFFVASLLLLLVCVHLSVETSRLEDETRALAEEVALLRLQVEQPRTSNR